MAAGLAVLDVIEREQTQRNAKERGAQLRAGLDRLQRDHHLVGDVRGMGLMLGVELVTDRGAKTPAKSETIEILEGCRENGLLIGKGGIDGNVLRIKPPMCVTEDDVDFALDVLDRALAAASHRD